MTRTTVLVASPSSISRARMAKLVASLPGHEVVALTADLSETFNAAEIREPDLVIIAEEFGGQPEFSVMETLFEALGTQWILLEGAAHPNSLRRPGVGPTTRPRIDLTMSGEQVACVFRALQPQRKPVQRLGETPSATRPSGQFDKMVLIGSSTGGVDALLTLLMAFPADCPPTAIVQHTGRGFSESLVQLLARRVKPAVVTARDGLVMHQGQVCVAGGTEGHLVLSPGDHVRCLIRQGPAVSGHVPSIDILFRSAVPMAPRSVGVILTGMGQDGAAGLLELRRAGGITIGQDQATSVVYGMPRAAWEMGAVQMQMPIQRIADAILHSAGTPSDTGLSTGSRVVAR